MSTNDLIGHAIRQAVYDTDGPMPPKRRPAPLPPDWRATCEFPVRIIVTRDSVIHFDEVMTYNQARAFWPWVTQHYGQYARTAISFTPARPKPAHYEGLPVQPHPEIVTEFKDWYRRTYTDRGRFPF